MKTQTIPSHLMRILLLLFFFCFSIAKAQIVNIPDANFKAKLISLGIDSNSDGEIQNSEALATHSLNVPNSNISNLTGIESFINLYDLNCSYNQLTNLNISNLTNLDYFDCSHNQLTNLNITGLTNFRTFNCSFNQLTNLDLSNIVIGGNNPDFYCQNNQLTILIPPSLNLPNAGISEFNCSNNLLTNLNFSNMYIFNLACSSNPLVNITLNNCRSFYFFLGNTNLQMLDLSNFFCLDNGNMIISDNPF